MERVNHISFSSSEGGAAIAAHRLHMALNASGVNSIMTVARGQEGPGITTFKPTKGLGRMIQREMARSIRRRHEADFSGLISLGQVRSGLAQYLNKQPSQILNLHWVNSDLMSIREIGNLSHPVVWTMHDMWPFCGVEHYSEGDDWKNGYATEQDSRASRLNRRVWKTKQRFWTRPFHLVAPSRWLADCARQSALTQEWPVSVIPNAIDTDVWRPTDRDAARDRLGLPRDSAVIGFGAMGGDSDPRKGFRHLKEALSILKQERSDIRVLIFGADAHEVDLPFPAHFTGQHSVPEELRSVYACADVFALPSRQDNLPNTGVEALSCGIPIVGFKIGGLPDLVPNPGCGRLAEPFDARDLADCLKGVIDDQRSCHVQGQKRDGNAARKHALQSYAMPIVAEQYRRLYETLGSKAQ
ncbi:glycosyltransferase [Ruegeria arenilitoris]|uniref:glycosyltransferase n=1 Tax=Ruegeria arenilitoris TaxID=1173585 RepID=UPI00266F3878|nr:glycosyltransferase [Ruegeria arenilitoris]